MIDNEVREMVEEAYKRTIALMEEKKEQVKLVAELLLKKETISHTDVADLIGERYFTLSFTLLFLYSNSCVGHIPRAKNMIVLLLTQDRNRLLMSQLVTIQLLLLAQMN
jgi:hypothetical protein